MAILKQLRMTKETKNILDADLEKIDSLLSAVGSASDAKEEIAETTETTPTDPKREYVGRNF